MLVAKASEAAISRKGPSSHLALVQSRYNECLYNAHIDLPNETACKQLMALQSGRQQRKLNFQSPNEHRMNEPSEPLGHCTSVSAPASDKLQSGVNDYNLVC
jgi:hypothetical protein